MNRARIAIMLRGLAGLAAIASIAFAAGCNTIEGIGQDVEAGGKAISKAASKNKPR